MVKERRLGFDLIFFLLLLFNHRDDVGKEVIHSSSSLIRVTCFNIWMYGCTRIFHCMYWFDIHMRVWSHLFFFLFLFFFKEKKIESVRIGINCAISGFTNPKLTEKPQQSIGMYNWSAQLIKKNVKFTHKNVFCVCPAWNAIALLPKKKSKMHT